MHGSLRSMPREELCDAARLVGEKVQADPLAADLCWSLFVSALHSYRHDTVLRPFPSLFVNSGNEKDIKSLETVVHEVPSIAHFPRSIASLPAITINLLKWIFEPKSFTLKTLNKNEFSSIQNKTGSQPHTAEPHYIFEVIPNKTSNDRFEELRQGRQVFYAYHGSRVENFYSILHNGLVSHMNKNGIFGEGTYLSSELSVSLHYSPSGKGWDKSELSNCISCIAVCEIIDDLSVKCQIKEGDDAEKKSRAFAPNSLAGEVPEKYYVVRNNEVVRVKYLLVYSDKSLRTRYRAEPSWFYHHRFALLMVLYVLFLVVIGLANSKPFQNQVRKFFRFWQDMYL